MCSTVATQMNTPPQKAPSTIERMVSMNNHGVRLLGEGALCRARQAFDKATDCMHEVLNEVEECMEVPSATKIDCFENTVSQRTEDTSRPAGVQFMSLREASSSWTPTMSGQTSHGHTSESPSPQYHVREASPSETINREPPSSNKRKRQDEEMSTSKSHRRTDSPDAGSAAPVLEEALYSFLRPVLFSLDDFKSTKNSPLLQLSVCLLFNLAVTNHTIALKTPMGCLPQPQPAQPSSPNASTAQQSSISRRSALEEAIYLYQLAYGLQVDGGVHVSWLHTMGIINNVARLQIHAQNRPDAHRWFETLLQLLLMEQVRRRAAATADLHQSSSDLHDPYIERFLDNVFQVVLSDRSGVSPAA